MSKNNKLADIDDAVDDILSIMSSAEGSMASKELLKSEVSKASDDRESSETKNSSELKQLNSEEDTLNLSDLPESDNSGFASPEVIKSSSKSKKKRSRKGSNSSLDDVPSNIYDYLVKKSYVILEQLQEIKDGVDPVVDIKALTDVVNREAKLIEVISSLSRRKDEFVEDNILYKSFIRSASKCLLYIVYNVGRKYLSKIDIVAFLNELSLSMDDFDIQVRNLIGSSESLSLDIVKELENRGESFEKLKQGDDSNKVVQVEFEGVSDSDSELERKESEDLERSLSME